VIPGWHWHDTDRMLLPGQSYWLNELCDTQVGSVGGGAKKRTMSSAAVEDSIIAWTRADISAIG
jgi:hypothetical protein